MLEAGAESGGSDALFCCLVCQKSHLSSRRGFQTFALFLRLFSRVPGSSFPWSLSSAPALGGLANHPALTPHT